MRWKALYFGLELKSAEEKYGEVGNEVCIKYKVKEPGKYPSTALLISYRQIKHFLTRTPNDILNWLAHGSFGNVSVI